MPTEKITLEQILDLKKMFEDGITETLRRIDRICKPVDRPCDYRFNRLDAKFDRCMENFRLIRIDLAEIKQMMGDYLAQRART